MLTSSIRMASLIWLVSTSFVVLGQPPEPLSDEEFELILHSGNPTDWLEIVVMTDSQAETVVKSSGWNRLAEAWLNGLASISERQAKILSKFGGNKLHLCGLDSLTDDQVKAISRWEAARIVLEPMSEIGKRDLYYSSVQIFLDGLTSITEKQAEYLSDMQVTDLSLKGLRSINDKQVRLFREAEADRIYLDGITWLTEEQLQILAGSNSKFGLRGLDRESRSKFKAFGGKIVRRSERPEG